MSVPKGKRTLSDMEFYHTALKLRTDMTLYLLKDFGVKSKDENTSEWLIEQFRKDILEEQKMNGQDFLDLCRKEVVKYINEHLDKTDHKQITTDDVFVIWSCKAWQDNKALLSTTLFDGMYEFTYNGDKKELYLDAYKKWENKCIKLGE